MERSAAGEMGTTRFIIWFNERSGSTHLSSLLDSHPKVACYREIFYRGEAGRLEDRFTRSGRPTIKDFMDRFFSYDWGPGGIRIAPERHSSLSPRAIGFKLKYQQIDRYPALREYLIEDPNLRVIHLVRANLVATIVSSKMLRVLLSRLGTTNIVADIDLSEVPRAVYLDPSALLTELGELELRIARAKHVVSHLPIIEVTYEGLILNQSRTCKAILSFLGIETESELTSNYQKIMPRSLKDCILNFDEIYSTLKGSRFEHHLERGRS